MTAAFFDLDNTLLKGSSMIHVARHLAMSDLLGRRELARAALQQASFRVTAREGSVAGTATRALQVIEGMDAALAETRCREALEPVMPQAAYSVSLALLRHHQRAGHSTFIATAAPIEIALVVADLLNMTGAVGTVAQRENGTYTGRLEGPVCHGREKAVAVARLAELHDVDLAASYAYSDSINDLPLLSMVGRPGVVNADRQLRKVALENGWPMHGSNRAQRGALVAVGTAAGIAAVGTAVVVLRRRGL